MVDWNESFENYENIDDRRCIKGNWQNFVRTFKQEIVLTILLIHTAPTGGWSETVEWGRAFTKTFVLALYKRCVEV